VEHHVVGEQRDGRLDVARLDGGTETMHVSSPGR
jgi:hypothetical protein